LIGKLDRFAQGAAWRRLIFVFRGTESRRTVAARNLDAGDAGPRFRAGLQVRASVRVEADREPGGVTGEFEVARKVQKDIDPGIG
jgi:hypothetical protein